MAMATMATMAPAVLGQVGQVGSGVPKLFCNFIRDFTLVKDKQNPFEIEIIETPILKDGSHFCMELH